ncbi:zinc metalloprotease [Cellulomonas alba]|uniref:Peptidase M11 gametolysin domain-containing protein n=1 Tax=Cellulomonas alba TaxID=3053467 RepID=A0ABT7SD97_9CELL|nr:hypothetical protein [Cellulomonas alba]MDM7854166.1 hypothetical protein [Cellulomonas alba]
MHLRRALATLASLTLAATVTALADPASAAAPPPPPSRAVAAALPGVHPTGQTRRAAHRLYVVAIQDPGARAPVSLATARASATAAGRIWVAQTRGAIPAFPVRGARTLVVPGSCRVADPWRFLERVGATAFPGVRFGQGTANHLVVFRPNSCPLRWGAGLASIGAYEHEGGRVLMSTSVPSVLEHELGHNLGLRHTNLALPGGRGSHEYLGGYDAMCGDPRPGWLSVADQLRLAVPGTARHVRVVRPSAHRSVVRTTLHGAQTTRGVRGLTFQDPATGSRYVVELRDGRGFDAHALYARGYGRSSVSSSTWYAPGVRVTRIARDGSVDTLSVRSGRTYRTALGARQTLVGPGGRFRVHVDALGRSTARVTLVVAPAHRR